MAETNQISNSPVPYNTFMGDKTVPKEVVEKEPEKLPEGGPEEVPVQVSDNNSTEEKIKADNVTSDETSSTEEPDGMTYREIPKEQVVEQAARWLKGYHDKTGIFDPEEGELKGFSALQVAEYIKEKENIEGEENSITQFLKKEFGTIAEREEWSILDWTWYNTKDQVK